MEISGKDAIADNMISIVNSLQFMTEFFGESLDNVGPLNLLIALYNNRPEWLRGLSKPEELPRRSMSNDLPYQFITPPTDKARAELAVWIIENCYGQWNINNRWVSFDLDEDAANYKLRYG